jgi:hypothetical protein
MQGLQARMSGGPERQVRTPGGRPQAAITRGAVRLAEAEPTSHPPVYVGRYPAARRRLSAATQSSTAIARGDQRLACVWACQGCRCGFGEDDLRSQALGICAYSVIMQGRCCRAAGGSWRRVRNTCRSGIGTGQRRSSSCWWPSRPRPRVATSTTRPALPPSRSLPRS